MAKFIFECVSKELSGVFGTATGTFICIGSTACLLLGLTLPTEKEEYGEDEWWRLTFGFPLLISMIITVPLLFVYKYEPIDFNIKWGKDSDALSLIKMLYRQRDEKSTISDDEAFK